MSELEPRNQIKTYQNLKTHLSAVRHHTGEYEDSIKGKTADEWTSLGVGVHLAVCVAFKLITKNCLSLWKTRLWEPVTGPHRWDLFRHVKQTWTESAVGRLQSADSSDELPGVWQIWRWKTDSLWRRVSGRAKAGRSAANTWSPVWIRVHERSDFTEKRWAYCLSAGLVSPPLCGNPHSVTNMLSLSQKQTQLFFTSLKFENKAVY